MAASRPRRAAEASPRRAGAGFGALRSRVVDGLLWLLGGIGAVCLVAALAAHVWGFSIVLFSTGSMSPTIPAGSAALVRLVPASQLEIGDVTTVERPGQLPITHRITSIQPLAAASSARVITMRGDANPTDDPEPYVISDARVVLASAPGVAAGIANLRDPRLTALLTLVAGVLVTWAFWPRQARTATAVAAAAVVAGAQLLATTEAQAVETEHQVVGTHLVLTVVSDADELASMIPGRTVFWQVGVTTRGQEEGAVHVGLGLVPGSVAADGLRIDVLACPQRWQGQDCAGSTESWVSNQPLDQAFLPVTHDTTREFGVVQAGEPLWVQVRATLDRPDPNVQATLRMDAWGAGEVVSAETGGAGGKGPGSGLAYTGTDGIVETLALAGAAIASGLVVARLAGVRRRHTDREGAQ